MKNKIIPFVLIGLALVAGIIFIISRNSSNGEADTSGVILFYGEGCPHCKNVDDFLTQNNVENKVQFQKLEVFYNNKNADLLGQMAKKCGLDSETVGVPFLWDGTNSTCASGDVEVINFFKGKIGS